MTNAHMNPKLPQNERPETQKRRHMETEKRDTVAQWGRTARNWDVSTGPLARPFARSFAPLARLLAPDCSHRSRPLLRSLRSLPGSRESEFLMSLNDLILPNSASGFFRLEISVYEVYGRPEIPLGLFANFTTLPFCHLVTLPFCQFCHFAILPLTHFAILPLHHSATLPLCHERLIPFDQ